MPDPTPDSRATLELVTDRTNYIEQCVTTGGLSPSGCQTTVAILRDAIRDLRRLVEVEGELAGLKKANALMNSGMESVCDLRDAEKQIMREVKSDRDAGWAAADALAGALEKLIDLPRRQRQMEIDYPAGTCNADDAWRDFGREEDLIHASAVVVLAAYTAARAARNPNPEGRT